MNVVSNERGLKSMVSSELVSIINSHGTSGHCLAWWGLTCDQFAMDPKLQRTILRKSLTFAFVELREDKSSKTNKISFVVRK